MRGRVERQGDIFHSFNLEELVPQDHPLRAVKVRADRILTHMSPRFSRAYGKTGRPSIPPERLIKALLLQALYSIRSETQLVEQISYNMLYRWFLDLNPSDEVWVQEVFSMNRQRFEQHGFVRIFFEKVVEQAILEDLVSGDHFSVDGTLIKSYASLKSLRPIDTKDTRVSDGSDDDDQCNPTVNFRGQTRTNATHRSIVDSQARLARRGHGKPAVLSHSMHILMENRSGLCVDVAVDEANGRAERLAAAVMLERTHQRHGLSPRTLGADANYREGALLAALEGEGIVPHVPMPAGPIRGGDKPAEARRRAKRRMKTQGYAISQRVRKRVEEIFGWCKTIGQLARTRFVGRWKIKLAGQVTAAAYNLLRMARLAPVT
ncbi:MAG: IS5 family transposase [Planctomycetota bacterium]|jgi:transposase